MTAQLAIDFVRARRDDGIERAGDHAGLQWRRGARGYLMEFIATKPGQFLAEDARAFAEGRGFALPPDGRAWGVVFQSAARERLIVKVGYAPARSSNLSPKVLWCASFFTPSEIAGRTEAPSSIAREKDSVRQPTPIVASESAYAKRTT